MSTPDFDFVRETVVNAGGVTAAATTMQVPNTDVFDWPTPSVDQWLPCRLIDQDNERNYEDVRITSRVGNVLTLVRDQGGTNQAWRSGTRVQIGFTNTALNLAFSQVGLDAGGEWSVEYDGGTALSVDGTSGSLGGDVLAFDRTSSSIVLFPTHNSTDGGTTVITAPGTASYPNHAGTTGKPLAADFTPTGWADDSGYVAGSADVCAILGGYDHVVNQIAGTVCGGGHNFIKYNTGGHSFIGGGSYNLIAGARSGVMSGRANSISAGVFNAIVCGDENECSSSGYGFIGSGDACTVSGAYSGLMTGLDCTVSGDYSTCIGGRDNTASHNYASVSGRGALAVGSGDTIGGKILAEAGDCQSVTHVQGIRTTDATLTNLASEDGFIDLPAGKVTAGTARILLVGMRDGSADGNNDSDYTQVGYEAEVGFWWDGTNGFFFGNGTQTSVSSSPSFNLTAVSGNTNNDFTPGAAPSLAINTGALRLKVTGIAGAAINWSARLDIVMTLVS